MRSPAMVLTLVLGPSACGASASDDSVAGDEAEASTQTEGSASESDSVSTGETDSSETGDGMCGSWCPSPGTSWQWQLTGQLETSLEVTMFDIDLFDTSASTIAAVQAEDRIVICYFSAGSHEDWRPDAREFPPAAIGEPLDGWPGERWLDVRDGQVRAIMQARLDLALDKGCDGVEPDNVDGWANQTGFDLGPAEQLDYNRFLAVEAHARGLSIGLKNDLEQIPELVEDFDWALDEECLSYDECELLEPFLLAGKAVFHVEYVDDPAEGPALADAVCPAVPLGFSTLIKTWDLDAWRIACE